MAPGTKFEDLVEPGRTEECFEQYVFGRVTWDMKGGSLTYGECRTLLIVLNDLLYEEDHLENHPFNAAIYHGEDLKFRLEMGKLSYEKVMIGELPFPPDRSLRLRAQVITSRRLLQEDVINVLNQAINKHNDHLDDTVSSADEFVAGAVKIETKLLTAGAADFKYSMLQRLFKDLLHYCQTNERYVAIDDAEIIAEQNSGTGNERLLSIRMVERPPPEVQQNVQPAQGQVFATD